MQSQPVTPESRAAARYVAALLIATYEHRNGPIPRDPADAGWMTQEQVDLLKTAREFEEKLGQLIEAMPWQGKPQFDAAGSFVVGPDKRAVVTPVKVISAHRDPDILVRAALDSKGLAANAVPRFFEVTIEPGVVRAKFGDHGHAIEILRGTASDKAPHISNYNHYGAAREAIRRVEGGLDGLS